MLDRTVKPDDFPVIIGFSTMWARAVPTRPGCPAAWGGNRLSQGSANVLGQASEEAPRRCPVVIGATRISLLGNRGPRRSSCRRRRPWRRGRRSDRSALVGGDRCGQHDHTALAVEASDQIGVEEPSRNARLVLTLPSARRRCPPPPDRLGPSIEESDDQQRRRRRRGTPTPRSQPRELPYAQRDGAVDFRDGAGRFKRSAESLGRP